MSDDGLNAGVSAQNGFAFQRNLAIYILLNDYHSRFSNSDYFICLEHLDDVIFCILDANGDADIVDAYQAKKKSPDRWTLDKELAKILVKLLKTAIEIRKDQLAKSKKYKHQLHFASNSSIFLEFKPTYSGPQFSDSVLRW